MATQPEVRAGNALALLRAALEQEEKPPAGYHSVSQLAAELGRPDRTVREWLQKLRRRVPIAETRFGTKAIRMYLISAAELQQAAVLMHGLESIRAINAAAASKGKTDTATHRRIARNEQIRADLARQRKGRTGK